MVKSTQDPSGLSWFRSNCEVLPTGGCQRALEGQLRDALDVSKEGTPLEVGFFGSLGVLRPSSNRQSVKL